MGDASRLLPGPELRDVAAAEAGRVDAVIAAAWPDLSRARVQRLIASGRVTVNGLAVRKSHLVEAGDRITVVVPAADPGEPAPAIHLPVLYEDDHLVGIDKPSGIAVHGGPGEAAPTVASWLAARYPGLASVFESDRPGIVHRLDKETTGVLIVAKTPAAQAALASAFEARQAQKTYVALCDGVPRLPRGVVDAAIGRHPADRTKMAIVRRGRAARTEYEVVAAARGRALIVARPETGRTHQIRVHLAAIGAPVSGDRVYGKGDGLRHLLHAWRLRLPHPDGGTLELTAPIPADMRLVAGDWGLEREAMPYCEPASPRREPQA